MSILNAAKEAKAASVLMATADETLKNNALLAIAEALEANKYAIMEANEADLKRSEEENLSKPLLKRLKFDENKINDVIEGLKSLISLKEPVGVTHFARELDQGLDLYQVSCPIGVIGVIFESRPDAFVQISALCLKSGNAVLLKGGSEAALTNKVLSNIIKKVTTTVGLPKGWIGLLESREEVTSMLKLDEEIDLIIPRGSNEFVRYIMDNSRIPVLGHADGICHTYVDQYADLDMAVDVVLDAKTQYVAVCNATETLLVHEQVAASLLPRLDLAFKQKKVIVNGCNRTSLYMDAKPATESTWKNEYLDYEISVKVVDDLDEAIRHINRYGSGHTDAIITSNQEVALKFMDHVDTGNAFWNCSTRFSDGFRYGFGAEVGVSTNKIHARGPVGLEGLLIYKYKVIGHGHKAGDYASGIKSFTHKPLDKTFKTQ
ncbi:glutamate-5-semialdehyde dehydrogenase [Petrocella sp. FN5]|uniref:glutamate-5-semialdehyde dehydrogenase n=1 Tax=Petrocella sp. FN5 TaxID=3032002 RepID=UPI0023DC5F44|nr:glutamate-5-semialdehyde dehydrogenase [Petrocella sp. FN5]MDF1617673.1 glutamate-5-semialdehyde dehydrogenase [Petrocella sp. FN5]